MIASLATFLLSPYTVWLPVTVAVTLSPSARAVFVKLLFVSAMPSYCLLPPFAVIVTGFWLMLSVPFSYLIA